ncbi:hypothetical protein [Roseofilum casamattae]|uniref:Uncharacterized protein n=1 Tax=Roseofilum casamattae BLCC-M143 TaxID=3022442 RepID=A0ABT7BTR1_9CYAN|nr:hypothetical protein [Roseofilum casamattae]MDJ1182579.1 hypothetical protein [Roseofilum casamattae BLCC-M143]
MQFHVWGIVSSFLYFCTWYGFFHQFQLLRDRRQLGLQKYTHHLSAQQFLTSFAACFAIFFLGLTRPEFNHYLVWPRLGALFLMIAVLWEIHLDRRSHFSIVSVIATAIALSIGVVLMMLRPLPFAISISADLLAVAIAAILAYGILHQIRLFATVPNIPLSGTLLLSLVVKDFATVGFGLTMPLEVAWSLLLLNGSSFILKSYLLIQVSRASISKNR